jgi:hypothetical protein
MPCKACGSDNVESFKGELTATYPTINGIKAPPVYICQELLVCLDCGFAELRVPVRELKLLKNSKQPLGS